MPPKNLDVPQDVNDEVSNELQAPIAPAEQKRLPLKIVWRNVIWFSVLHCMALYGLFLLPWAHAYTWIWSEFCCCYFVDAVIIIGITFI